jgi:hypothetical protein
VTDAARCDSDDGMLIDIAAGARPNMKIAPVIGELRERQAPGGHLRYRLVYTSQYYDAPISVDFFVQLRIPQPEVNLQVGSRTQAEQTAAVILGYGRLFRDTGFAEKWERGGIPEKWDGRSGERIARVLDALLRPAD